MLKIFITHPYVSIFPRRQVSGRASQKNFLPRFDFQINQSASFRGIMSEFWKWFLIQIDLFCLTWSVFFSKRYVTPMVAQSAFVTCYYRW